MPRQLQYSLLQSIARKTPANITHASIKWATHQAPHCCCCCKTYAALNSKPAELCMCVVYVCVHLARHTSGSTHQHHNQSSTAHAGCTNTQHPHTQGPSLLHCCTPGSDHPNTTHTHPGSQPEAHTACMGQGPARPPSLPLLLTRECSACDGAAMPHTTPVTHTHIHRLRWLSSQAVCVLTEGLKQSRTVCVCVCAE